MSIFVWLLALAGTETAAERHIVIFLGWKYCLPCVIFRVEAWADMVPWAHITNLGTEVLPKKFLHGSKPKGNNINMKGTIGDKLCRGSLQKKSTPSNPK